MADKGKELLGKVRIEFAECSLMPQTCDLLCFPFGIGEMADTAGPSTCRFRRYTGTVQPTGERSQYRCHRCYPGGREGRQRDHEDARTQHQTPRCIWNHSIAAASVRRLPWWEWPRSVA